jgi:hypothetical protein
VGVSVNPLKYYTPLEGSLNQNGYSQSN